MCVRANPQAWPMLSKHTLLINFLYAESSVRIRIFEFAVEIYFLRLYAALCAIGKHREINPSVRVH